MHYLVKIVEVLKYIWPFMFDFHWLDYISISPPLFSMYVCTCVVWIPKKGSLDFRVRKLNAWLGNCKEPFSLMTIGTSLLQEQSNSWIIVLERMKNPSYYWMTLVIWHLLHINLMLKWMVWFFRFSGMYLVNYERF